MHSIIQSGMIPGIKSNRRDRQSVFFAAVNPMDDNQDLEAVQYNLAWKKLDATWPSQGSHHPKILGDFVKAQCTGAILSSQKGLQFYQTRSHAIVLYKLPEICFEKAVCMKTKEELYHKENQSPRLPRVVLAGDLDAEVLERAATSAVPLKGPHRAKIGARNLTHMLATPWCEICVRARGQSGWHARVEYVGEILCVHADDGRHRYWVRWSSDGLG